jgi:hypothetical protein
LSSKPATLLAATPSSALIRSARCVPRAPEGRLCSLI